MEIMANLSFVYPSRLNKPLAHFLLELMQADGLVLQLMVEWIPGFV